MDRTDALRTFFGNLVTANAGIPPGSELAAAFASTPRELFVGPAPWKIFTPGGYIETLSDDPAFLYQDLLLALDRERRINIGMPSAHAYWLGASNIKEAETVVQVGAGSGYYTAILAHLVGVGGRVYAYEIEERLAARARATSPRRKADSSQARHVAVRVRDSIWL